MLETRLSVPFCGHVRQYHNVQAEIDTKMQEVLESGQYVMGPMLKKFEAELALFHGTRYAIGVGNGTDALFLAFKALGIGARDECITTVNTFFATAEAIGLIGAAVVFVDSDSARLPTSTIGEWSRTMPRPSARGATGSASGD